MLRTCLVSLTDVRGTRHSVEVTAESLYEAAILGLNLLRKDQWLEKPGPGTWLEVEVKEPTVRHQVTVQQLKRWLDGASINPAERLRKDKLKELFSDVQSKPQPS